MKAFWNDLAAHETEKFVANENMVKNIQKPEFPTLPSFA